MWVAAQAFSVLAAVIGGISGCASCCGMFRVDGIEGKMYALPLAVAFLLTTVCQGLSFLFFASKACDDIELPVDVKSNQFDLSFEPGCSTLSTGSIFAICGCVFWFLTTVAAGVAAAEEKKLTSVPEIELKKTDEEDQHAQQEQAKETGNALAIETN